MVNVLIQVAAMFHDGTPVQDQIRKVMIKKAYQGAQPSQNLNEEKALVDGVAAFDVEIPAGCVALQITVSLIQR